MSGEDSLAVLEKADLKKSEGVGFDERALSPAPLQTSFLGPRLADFRTSDENSAEDVVNKKPTQQMKKLAAVSNVAVAESVSAGGNAGAVDAAVNSKEEQDLNIKTCAIQSPEPGPRSQGIDMELKNTAVYDTHATAPTLSRFNNDDGEAAGASTLGLAAAAASSSSSSVSSPIIVSLSRNTERGLQAHSSGGSIARLLPQGAEESGIIIDERLARDENSGNGEWDLPPPLLESQATESSTAPVDPRQGRQGPSRCGNADGANVPIPSSVTASASQGPPRQVVVNSQGRHSSRRPAPSRPGAVSVAGPGRAPPMPTLSRELVLETSRPGTSPPPGSSPNNRPRVDHDGGRLEVEPTDPAPQMSAQERHDSLGAAGHNEIDLIPRVEATLVSHDEDDEDEGNDDELPGERDEETGRGGGGISVNPLDFAHTVAVPAESVIPIPTDDEGSGVGTTGRALDDRSDHAEKKSAGGSAVDADCCWSCKGKNLGNRRTCAAKVMCLLIIVVAAAVGASVGLTTKRNGSAAADSNDVSEPPEQQEQASTSTTTTMTTVKPKKIDPVRFEDVRSKIQQIYDKVLPDFPTSDVLYDENTDQYAALWWVAHDDPAQVHHSYVDQLRQRYAAAALYFSTGGRADAMGRAVGGSWLDRFYWLSDRHECEWVEDMDKAGFWGPRGFACDDARRVIAVSLFSNNLTGTLPVELAFFDHLDLLYLIDNDIHGTLPTELGALTSISEIMLSANYGLYSTIPAELGNLSNLRVLSAWGNELSGTIPTELGRLKNLERLSLNNCSITGDIPQEMALNSIMNGGKLKDMYVHFTELTGSMEFLCLPQGDNATMAAENDAAGWANLEADCLEDIDCSCCTLCY